MINKLVKDNIKNIKIKYLDHLKYKVTPTPNLFNSL